MTPHAPSRCPADDALIEQFTPTKEQIMTAAQTTGIIVSTHITAGPGSGSGGVWLNHCEGLVAR
jgi:hypothetical protein